ncbi:MAG: hypothetical protein JSR79_09320 [Proteobacteria bacterium]|nr:hypothetical protein [Pseudomonadota bacterium]
MRSRAVRHAGRCIGLVAMVGAPAAAHAQDVRASMIASVGGSVESNPYNEANPGGAAVAATAELRPTLTARDDRNSVSVSGMVQLRQFLRRYGLEDNCSVDAGIVRRQAEWLTLRGSSSFAYTQGGFNGFGRPSLSVVNPAPVTPDPMNPTPGLDPLTGLSDVNILGQRTRIKSFGAGLGADMVLGAYLNLTADFDARAMRFQTAGAGYDDYNTLHGELHLSHQLDENLSIGLIGGYGVTNYLDLGQGDAGTADILASLDGKLGARWTVSLSVGGSFTTIDGRGGRPDGHYCSISTRVGACWQGEFSQFCLGGQRSPQPAANGNVRVSSTVTADYSTRLSDRERLSLSGSYARTGRSRDLTVGAQPALDFAAASARYDNQLDNKLSAFVSANVSKTWSPLVRRKANVGLAVGLQYSFGAAQ